MRLKQKQLKKKVPDNEATLKRVRAYAEATREQFVNVLNRADP
jgi:hypothetical protein